MNEMREKLGSRLGFILLSAGCAIGIGNVWRFPYVTGQSGGGWFVLVYLFFLALLGIPVLVMEFAVGRAAQKSLAKAHAELTPERKTWQAHGVAGLLGNVLLMMFYTTVTGWMILYFLKMAEGDFAGMSPDEIGAIFGEMLSDPLRQVCAMIGVCVGSAAVCAFGLQKGLERVTKWMMLALLALIAVLAVNSVCLDGAREGLRFYLVPDFARMRSVGILTVIANAMNQAFFTLSLGIGAMTIFGSYIERQRTLFGEAVNVAVLDTVVAICAGLIIIPACFAFNVNPDQGPGLIFVTLPNVFRHMSCGRIWGSLFFLFMSFAALSTVLAVFENIIACIRDYTGWERCATCALVGGGIAILSVPCILGFNAWSAFHPFGAGTNVLDLEDFLVSDILLPLGAFAFALYCCHRYGWGWEKFIAEANAGEGLRFPRGLRLYCAYGLPCVVVLIFVLGLIRRFS